MKPNGRLIALCVLGVGFNAFLYGPSLRLTATGVNDFMDMYSGARLGFTGGMYDLDRNLQVMKEAAGWESTHRLFIRPPFDALLMWPLGRLPYREAAIVWETLIVLSIALFCYVWPGDRRTAVLVCCWSYPLFDVFADGQDVALLLVFVALAMREMKRGRQGVAGLIFSLCSIKAHLFLLVPILVVRHRLWRFAWGLALGGGILFAVSFVPGGWDWPWRMAALLKNPASNPWPDAMPTVHGLTASLPNAMLWQVLGTLGIAAIAWTAARRGSVEFGLAAVLAGGILVAPHAYLSDCALTVPALLITLPLAATWNRYLHLFLLSPFWGIGTVLHATWITGGALIIYLCALAFTPNVCDRPKFPHSNFDCARLL